MPKAPTKSRSGTQWTEEDYAAAGVVRMNLRLPTEDAARLDALAERLGLSRARTVAVAVSELANKNRPKGER